MNTDRNADSNMGLGHTLHNYSPIGIRRAVMARATSKEQSRRVRELEAQVRIQTAIGVLQGVTLLFIVYMGL